METLNNTTLFQFAISEGMGFTESCNMTQNDPKVASAYLMSAAGKEMMEKVLSAHRNAYISKLNRAKDLKANNSDVGKADELLDQVRKVPGLILWGVLLPIKKNIDVKTVISALLKVRYPLEVATGLGMTYDEYVDYIRENEMVAEEIKRLGLKIPLV